MPYGDPDLDAGLVPTPRGARPLSPHLDELTRFAQENKLTVGSTTGGRHNLGSKHYSGNAVDIRNSGGFDDATVRRISQAAASQGLIVRDERKRPPRQKVWGGPHIHIEYAGDIQSDPDLDAGLAIEPVPRTASAQPVVAPEVQPLRQPRVTSEVRDYEPEKLDPVRFQPDDYSNLNRLTRGVLGMSQSASMAGMELPKTHPDLIGKPISATFQKQPTVEEVDDAILGQFGKGYSELAQRFRVETGVPLTSNAVGLKQNPDGTWTAFAKPSQGFVDAVNAYALRGRKGYESAIESQALGRSQVAKDIKTEIARNEGVRSDLGSVAAGEIARNAQYVQNLGDLVRGQAPEDDPNALAIQEAQRNIPRPKTWTGSAADLGVSTLGVINRAGTMGGNLPLEQTISNLQQGPEAAYKAGVMSLPLVTAGPITRAVGADLSPLAQRGLAAGTGAYSMAAPTALSGGTPKEVAESAVLGGVFPQLEGYGKRGQVERISDAQPIGEKQPSSLPADAQKEPPVVESSAQRGSDVPAGAPVSQPEPVRHVDLQPRRQRGEAKGQFKKETRAQAEERRAKVNQPAETSPETAESTLTPSPPSLELVKEHTYPESGLRNVTYIATVEGKRIEITGRITADGIATIERWYPEAREANIGRNELGAGAMRRLARQLKELHPEVKSVTFEREGSTGGEWGREREFKLPQPNEDTPTPSPAPSQPASEDLVRGAQSPSGPETHPTVRRFLSSEHKDKILGQIGADAEPLNPTELGGIKASSVSFRKSDGSIVTVEDAAFSESKPTYGSKRDGFVVSKSKPAATPPEVTPSQPSPPVDDVKLNKYMDRSDADGIRKVGYEVTVGGKTGMVQLAVNSEGAAKINVVGLDDWANSVGSRMIFKIRDALKEQHPEIKTLSFERKGTTGGEFGRARTLKFTSASTASPPEQIKPPTTAVPLAPPVEAAQPVKAETTATPPAIRSAVDVKSAMRRHFNLPEEQADAVSRIADARAETWAKQTGKTKEEWYTSRIADITGGKPAEGALYQEGASPFYSQLSRVVDQKMPNRTSGEQLRAIVESPQSGVKADEIKWTGLDDFLQGKRTVSKQEVQDFLRQNHVEVREVTKGEPKGFEMPKLTIKARDLDYVALDEKGLEWGAVGKGTVSNINEAREYLNRYIRERETESLKRLGDKTATKFEKFQLPGGENYRELLLTLPEGGGVAPLERGKYDAQLALIKAFEEASGRPRHEAIEIAQAARGGTERFVTMLRNAMGWERANRMLTAARDAHDAYNTAFETRAAKRFTSPHFNEPNILAHIRFNDRVVDGKKVLFIEEVQSDWHQKGRQKGYKSEALAAPTERDIELKFIPPEVPKGHDAKIYPGYWESFDKRTGQMIARHGGRMDRASAMKEALQYGHYEGQTRSSEAVPDAPFKKTWHELAMKRMLRYATENGYDRVAWTTGEQQAERYDLSKQIDGIRWTKKPDGRVDVRIRKDGKTLPELSRNDQTPQELESLIGKEPTSRIINDRGPSGELTGAGLKIGGEGMKGFYDQILPSFMNKYGKKWGARVETARMAVGDERVLNNILREEFNSSWGDATPEQRAQAIALQKGGKVRGVHSVEITPSMKKSVMEGQPLFQDKKASTEFLDDNRAIIRGLEKPDISSAAHEMGHVFRRDLEGSLLKAAEQWAGVKDGKWEVLHEEKFARGFERYLRDGTAPTEQLKQVFQQFKEWLSNIYKTIKGSPIEAKLSPEIKSVFDELLGKEPAKPEPSITSARKEMMAGDRAALDLPELPAAERKSWQTSLDNAKPEKATVLADEVLTKPRALNDEETASLVVRAQQIKNEHSQVMKEIGATPDPDVISAKREQADTLQREFDRITEATKKSGTEKGRALASQKLTINQDFDLVSVLQRAKAAKGRELTVDERTKYEGLTKQVEELQTKLAKIEADALTKQIQRDIARIRRQAKRGETRQVLDAEFADLRTQFAQAKLEIKGVQPSGLAGLDPEGKLTPIILKMARNRVRAGIVEAEAVIDQVYNAVKEHIEGVKRDDIKALLAGHDLEHDPLPAIKTRLRGQEQELTRRIAEKDYSEPPKRKPVVYDREASDLKARVEQLKRKIDADIRGNDSKLDTILAMRKAGMLTGIRTHMRNVGGTAAFQGFEEAARLPGAVADLLISTVTKRRALGAPNPIAVAKSSYEAATKGLREAKQIMKYGATAEDLAKFEVPRELNSGSKVIDAYVNTVFRSLGAEDKVFRTYAYKRSIEDQARLRSKEFKKPAKELAENPTAEMAAQAILDAEVATFNNQNKLAEGVEWLRRSSGSIGSTAVDLVLPFKRTPANIASRLLESTPLGLARGGVQLVKAAINKGMSFAEQRKFSQTIGRSVTGSSLIVLGYWLASKGLATGLSEDDRGDREVQKASGRSPLSIKVGNNWHQIGAFSPIGNLVAIGAALHREQTRPLKEGEERGNIATAAVPVGAKVLLEQPFLKGASGVVDAIQNPGTRGEAFAGQTVGSFVPTVVSDVGAAIDNKRRSGRGIVEKVEARIPLLRRRVPEDVDVFGRPLQSRRTAMVDPTLTSTASKDPFIQELVRLDVGVVKSNRKPDEDESKYRERIITQGKAMAKELATLVETRGYKSADDVKKRDMVKDKIAQVRKAVNEFIETGGKRKRPERRGPRQAPYRYAP